MGEITGDWSTDQTAGVSDHEGHLLGRDVFGCDDEIAFIFAVGGV